MVALPCAAKYWTVLCISIPPSLLLERMSTKAKAAAAAALNKPQRQSQVALMNRHCFFTDRVMPWLGTGLAALIIVPFAFQIVICTTLGFIFDKSGLNALIGSIGNHKFWHRFVTDKVNGQIAAWALWLSVCTFIPCFFTCTGALYKLMLHFLQSFPPIASMSCGMHGRLVSRGSVPSFTTSFASARCT